MTAPLAHHVFFRLKNHGSEADRAELIAGIEGLKAIEVIRAIHIGVPAATAERGNVDRSWDVSELAFFDSVEDEGIYQVHPLHLAFIERCKHLWDTVKVYDAIGA